MAEAAQGGYRIVAGRFSRAAQSQILQFISQVENGFSRVPIELMGAWAEELGLEPRVFARHLVMYYEPELHRLLFGAESK